MWLVGSKPVRYKCYNSNIFFAWFFAQMTSCFVHYDVGGWQPYVSDELCGWYQLRKYKYPFLLSGLRAQPSDVFYFLWIEAWILKMSKWSEGNRKWYSLCGLSCDSSFYVVFHSTSGGTGGILAWEYSRHTSLTDSRKLRPKRSTMGGGCIRRLQGILAVCFIYFISLYCIVLHFKYFISFHFLLLYFICPNKLIFLLVCCSRCISSETEI